MSADDNKALVGHFYEQLDAKNFDVYDGACSPGFLSHFPGSDAPQKANDRKQIFTLFYDAFPDLRHSIEDMIAEGDTVAVRLTVRGTHQSKFMNIPPTGGPIEFTAMHFYRIADGKLAEEWANFDSLGLVKQLSANDGP